MTAERDDEKFAQLVDALGPYLARVVIVGGWARRLFRNHPLAQTLPYAPLTQREEPPAHGRVSVESVRTGPNPASEVMGRLGRSDARDFLPGAIESVKVVVARADVDRAKLCIRDFGCQSGPRRLVEVAD